MAEGGAMANEESKAGQTEEIPDPLQQMLRNLLKLQKYFQDYDKLLADARQAEREHTSDAERMREAAEARKRTMREQLGSSFKYVLDLDDFVKNARSNLDLEEDKIILDKIMFKKRELVNQYNRLFGTPKAKKKLSPSKHSPGMSGCDVSEEEEEEEEEKKKEEETMDL